MSLLVLYLLSLLLFLSSEINYTKTFEDICDSRINNASINNVDNFQSLVKFNFEMFLCDLIKGIYNNSFNIMEDIFGNGDEMGECFIKINESFHNEKSTFYYHFFSYSGSRINKLGDERKCVNHKNLTYYLIKMISDYVNVEENYEYLNKKNNEEINETSQYKELYGFLENNKYYLGFCLWKKCIPFFDIFFNRSKNEYLFNYLNNHHYTARSWTFINSDNKNQESKNKLPFILAVIFIIFILVIRIILRMSYYCTEKNQMKEPKFIKLNPLAPSPEEIQLTEQNIEYSDELENEDSNNNNIDNKNNNIKDKNKKDNNNIDNQLSMFDTETRFSKLSSIMTRKKTQAEIFLEQYHYISIDNIYQIETKSYNSKNLLEIGGLKLFLLFFISFYHVYNIFYSVRWNSPGTISFYQSILHILLAKLSKTSFRIWIFFDGFEWCFKLLSYLNKLKIKKVTFKHLMIFNINLFEKIIVFIIIFYIFIYQFKSIGNFYFTSLFELHSENYTTIKCHKYPLYIIILPILGLYEDIGKYEYCYNFTYILVNELYSMIICTFLFFIFFKLKSKVCEYSFLILFFLSIIFIFLYFKKIYGQFYYQRYVLGEDLSIKYIGLFFHYFFIGCISGLVYYYSTLMNLDLEQYNIFENCYKFMYFYIKMNHVLRHSLGFLSLFLIFISCCYYPFLFKLGIINKFRLIKKVDFFTYMVISYENIIQIFLFMIFFFDVILSSEIFTKIFLSNDIFIIFERCSFIFLIICEQVVFFFETMIYLDGVYWNTENIIFLSIICFLITLFISFVLTFFIQLPIRWYTKQKGREILDEYESDYKFKYL